MRSFDVHSHRYKRDNLEKLETVFSKEDSEDFGRESMLKHGHHAKDYYEIRLSELSKTVASTVAALTDDQLLSTMLEEPTSRPFAQHRVKEIIEECMENDREGLIKQLTEQLAALESDYCELEQEYSKVYQEQKDNIQELQEKIEEMQTQHNSDVKERESIMMRMDNLKQSTEELTEKYENRLKSKERETTLKSERQQTEAKMLADRLNDLQKKNDEFQEELDTKRREFYANEKKLSEANELLLRYESNQQRQSEDIIKLNEENIRLREKLVQYEDGKKAFEDGFRQRIKDIEKGIENEKESDRQKMENLQNKYEEKMEKYKEKITSYKTRLTEKENELEAAISKHREIILALENKLDDQKVKLEHTLSQVESDHNKFSHEQREHYEKNLQNLEKRFEDVFDRKLHQLQNEAEIKIEHLKHEKAKLQRLLEEKQFIMEREYIKVAFHEEAMQDKNNVIKRLEQDLLDQDYESNCRLKDLEQRLNSESNLKQLESQRLISGLEVQASELKAQKNLLESEKLNLKKDNQSLREELQASSSHNARLIDTVEQWTSKAEKLDLACEEELARGRELEQKIAEYKERYQELKKAYEATVEENLEKDMQMRKLTDQISVLEKDLKQRGAEGKNLNIKSQNLEEEIFRLREQLEDSKKQERANDLRAFENEEKLKRLTFEIEEVHRENNKLNSDGEALRKQKHDLKAKLSKVTEICKRITKEKQSTEKNLERAVTKINKMESSITKAILAKVAIFKNELNEMREHQRVMTSRMTKENEAKIMELTKHFMGILTQAKEQQAQELQKEFNYQYEGLKEKSLRMEKDLEEMYEQKYMEKERNVKYIQDINNKLNENIKSLKEDYERLQLKYSRCQDEAEKTSREKANAESRLDQLRQQYVSEINSFNYELQKCSQEFMSQKIILQDERATEIKNLLAEVEKLKNINQETLTKYQAQVQQLSTRYNDEIETLERSYKAEAQEVTKMLTESRLVEQELAIKMLDLNEKVHNFETKNYELEKENIALKQKEDDYLGLYESKIDELKTMITKDNERMNVFKTEKFKELSNYKSTIITFEKEVSLKDKKIEDLSEERELLKRRMQELVTQNNVLESQRSKQKFNRTENEYLESKENSKLRSKTLENDGGLDTFLATASISRRKYPTNEISKGFQGKPNSTALTLNNSRFSKKDVESLLVSTRKSQYRNPLGTHIPTNNLTLDDFDS